MVLLGNLDNHNFSRIVTYKITSVTQVPHNSVLWTLREVVYTSAHKVAKKKDSVRAKVCSPV